MPDPEEVAEEFLTEKKSIKFVHPLTGKWIKFTRK